jgi:multidrug efflux system membrane fusion protein
VLVRLDQRQFRAELKAARAGVSSHREHRDEARRELERAKELYERAVLSDHQLQTARIAVQQADAQLEHARAALVVAQLHLELSEIRAPFDAVVVSRDAEIGQAIVSQLAVVPLVTVAEFGRMKVRALVSAADLATVTAARAATVTVTGKTWPGIVRHVALEPAAEGAGGAYPVEVVIADEGEEIAIYVINEMFRMKMYFENAGKMAFARNMGMPGSIEDELKDKIRASLN